MLWSVANGIPIASASSAKCDIRPGESPALALEVAERQMTGCQRSGQRLLLDSHLMELTDDPHMHDVPTLERAVLGLQDSQCPRAS